ncbi:MAG: hypothetical protein QE263_04660 [Vampirovibrionales bacterium]|nr:hypothetical protein [Vampirovibrionales bacterium]
MDKKASIALAAAACLLLWLAYSGTQKAVNNGPPPVPLGDPGGLGGFGDYFNVFGWSANDGQGKQTTPPKFKYTVNEPIRAGISYYDDHGEGCADCGG